MTRNRFAAVLSLAAALPLGAQARTSCEGPGAALGVTAYQCASCGVKRDATGRVQNSFNAEPVVTEVALWSHLLPGDVIVAIGGKPITTAVGATLFSNPFDQSVKLVGDTIAMRNWRAGPLIVVDGVVQPQVNREKFARLVSVRVRRAGRDTPLILPLNDRCDDDVARRDWTKPVPPGDVRSFLDGIDQKTIEKVEVIKGPMAQTIYGADASAGVVIITLKPSSDEQVKSAYAQVMAKLAQLNENVASGRSAQAPSGKFGLALSCAVSCTKTRARDGSDYWKFDAAPPIIAVREAGAAEAAGLKVGDIVTEVDGVSILTEDGQLRFMRAEWKDSMRLTVLRDGKKLEVVVAMPVWMRRKAP